MEPPIIETVMQVVTPLLAIASIVIAAVSATNAHKSRKRADEALDHQRRLDERDREFRDVVWRGALLSPPDASAGFELTNGGMTEAQSVVLVVHASKFGEAERFDFGYIRGGERVEVQMPYGEIHGRREFGWNPGFTVHWVSPLGYAARFEAEEHTDRLVY